MYWYAYEWTHLPTQKTGEGRQPFSSDRDFEQQMERWNKSADWRYKRKEGDVRVQLTRQELEIHSGRA